jgi:hypothetical protein
MSASEPTHGSLNERLGPRPGSNTNAERWHSLEDRDRLGVTPSRNMQSSFVGSMSKEIVFDVVKAHLDYVLADTGENQCREQLRNSLQS